MKTLSKLFFFTSLSFLFLGLLFSGCKDDSIKCDCSQKEMGVFVSNLSDHYNEVVRADQIECLKYNELWLVRFALTDGLDMQVNSYWDDLYDSDDSKLSTILPMELTAKDLDNVKPVIRKVRSNGYNLTFIKKLEEENLYSFEFTNSDKTERLIQQRYRFSNKNWVWVKNVQLWKKSSDTFRIKQLK